MRRLDPSRERLNTHRAGSLKSARRGPVRPTHKQTANVTKTCYPPFLVDTLTGTFSLNLDENEPGERDAAGDEFIDDDWCREGNSGVL